MIAFTVGSCRGNPGPCGAGVCVFLPNNDEIELKQPVSKLALILLGELVAIQITLNFLIEEKKVRDISNVLIFCDSCLELVSYSLVVKIKVVLWTYNSLLIYLKGMVQR